MQDHTSAEYLPPGTLFGNYEVREVLGQGGFGIIYRAVDHQLGREVAIKEHFPLGVCKRNLESMEVEALHDFLQTSYTCSLNSFGREARLLATLNHPNIVRIYDIFQALGTTYAVMSIEEGELLDTWIKGKFIVPEVVEKLLIRLLKILQYLHGKNILHRDIKPSNIIMGKDGAPILIDFGTALDGVLTRTITMMVSPAFSPPELYQEHGDIGPWSDLFSLGQSFLSILNGSEENYSSHFIGGLHKATKLSPKDRFHSVEDWMAFLNSSKKKKCFFSKKIVLWAGVGFIVLLTFVTACSILLFRWGEMLPDRLYPSLILEGNGESEDIDSPGKWKSWLKTGESSEFPLSWKKNLILTGEFQADWQPFSRLLKINDIEFSKPFFGRSPLFLLKGDIPLKESQKAGLEIGRSLFFKNWGGMQFENLISGQTTGNGAALYLQGFSRFSVTHNRGRVLFKNNIVNLKMNRPSHTRGGAIYGGENSSIIMDNNGEDIVFSGNGVMSTPPPGSSMKEPFVYVQGGAIYSAPHSYISLSGNAQDILFLDNFCEVHQKGNSCLGGGAIFGDTDSLIRICNNEGTVWFINNRTGALPVRQPGQWTGGGAICSYGNIIIAGNKRVVFSNNYDIGFPRLCGIYSSGEGGRKENTLVLSAPENGTIEFYDTLNVHGIKQVEFNRDYENISGKWTQSTGDIILSGKNAHANFSKNFSRPPNYGDLLNCLKSNLDVPAILHKGRLILTEDATLFTTGLSVKNGASLILDRATLETPDSDLVLESGATLTFKRSANRIDIKSLKTSSKSKLVFCLEENNPESPILLFKGIFEIEKNLILRFTSRNATLKQGAYALIKWEKCDVSSLKYPWITSQIEVQGLDISSLKFSWKDNVLYLHLDRETRILSDSS